MKAETAARRSCRVSRLRLMMADLGAFRMFNTGKAIGFKQGRFSFNEFDALPAEIRQAIANANFRWATERIYVVWRQGQYSTKAIVDKIKTADALATERAYAQRNAESLLKELGL